MSSSRRLAGLAACLSFSLPLAASAQSTAGATTAVPPPASSTAAPPTSDPGLSAEDMKALQDALGKDAAQASASGSSSAPMPASSSGVTISPSNINLKGLDLSFILDVAGAAFSSKTPLQTGDHDPTHNGFNFQQLEMSVNTAVDPYFRFNGNIVFHPDGVEVEEAYVTTSDLPANLQLRAGQFLTRYGRINSTHPHTWDFVDQPFAVGRIFGGDGNRGLGLEASWLSPLPWYLELVGSVTDASGEGTARSFLGSSDHGVTSPLDFQFTGAVKQFFPLSDDVSLLWGLSAAGGPNAEGVNTRTGVYGTDVYLKFRPISAGSVTMVTLQAELFYRRRQLTDNVLSDVNGYGQVLWRFDQRWAAAGRYEFGSPARGLDGAIALDPLDTQWTANRQRVSANITFWPTEFSRLRLQGATDVVGWRDRPETSLFLALEVVMGAHGAHAF